MKVHLCSVPFSVEGPREWATGASGGYYCTELRDAQNAVCCMDVLHFASFCSLCFELQVPTCRAADLLRRGRFLHAGHPNHLNAVQMPTLMKLLIYVKI